MSAASPSGINEINCFSFFELVGYRLAGQPMAPPKRRKQKKSNWLSWWSVGLGWLVSLLSRLWAAQRPMAPPKGSEHQQTKPTKTISEVDFLNESKEERLNEEWNSIELLLRNERKQRNAAPSSNSCAASQTKQLNFCWPAARHQKVDLSLICFCFFSLLLEWLGSRLVSFFQREDKPFHQLFLSIIEIDWMKGRIVEWMKRLVEELPLLLLNEWVMSRRLLCRERLPFRSSIKNSISSLLPLVYWWRREKSEFVFVFIKEIKVEWKREMNGNKESLMVDEEKELLKSWMGWKLITNHSVIKRKLVFFYGGGKQHNSTISSINQSTIPFHQSKSWLISLLCWIVWLD